MRKNRRRRRKAAIITLSVIAAILLALLTVWIVDNFTVTVKAYSVPCTALNGENESFRIALISDLHCRVYGRDNATLIKLTKKQNPDVILLCGDIISWNTKDFSQTRKLCEKLSEIADVYGVYGNHEMMCFDSNAELETEYVNIMKDAGVKMINNEKATIRTGDITINIYGLTQELYYYSGVNENGELPYKFTVADAEGVLGKPDVNINILLTHNPMYFEAYCEWGADLVLCGHMHGGVINIPFKGGLFSPANEYFPEYSFGKFTKGGCSMIVSRGLGEHLGRYRMFNPQELVVVNLKKNQQD